MSRTILIIAAFAFSACASTRDTGTSARSPSMASEVTERNKQTVRRVYEEAINAAEFARLPELVAADYVGPQGDRGPAGFQEGVESLRAGFPDIHFRIEELIAEGDRVVVRWTWSGRHTGSFRGFSPSNQEVNNSGIAIYQLRESKLVRGWLETDRLGAMQQMGVVSAGLGGGGATAR
jgi:predicted ester cyclase